MLEELSDRLGAIFQRLRSRGKLTEAEVGQVLREVRVALLEADVNLGVVKDFIARIRERAVGAEVLESLTPAQAVLGIVHEALVELLGTQAVPLRFAPSGPTVILLAGLQGSGKTTQGAKLALRLKEEGRRPLLVACDVYRPAAVEQLQTLGEQIGVPVFTGTRPEPLAIAQAALEQARQTGYGAVIVDTAGRLHVDETMLDELAALSRALMPLETLLVVDAMTGQEAVKVAQAFGARLAVTGVILTKADGDARGGAALSIRAVTQTPIKFIGTGEKVSALEPFHPDRLASRILGMGDVATLIEKTRRLYDERQAKELSSKIRRQSLTLEDFLEQLRQVRRMGPLGDVIKMLPGLGKRFALPDIDERELVRVEAIICSMTPRERRDPGILNASRRRRIAAGSGTHVADVNRLVKNFEASRRMLKRLAQRM
jgi:signal recognition particle subunit SRP54